MNENKLFDKKIGCHIKTLPGDKYRVDLFELKRKYRTGYCRIEGAIILLSEMAI